MIPALDSTLSAPALVMCWIEDPLRVLALAVLWAVLWFVPMLLVALGGYALFRLPLQRRERASLFLDLLDSILRRGLPVEDTLMAISRTHDPAMGVRFHLLAAHLEQGLPLGRAFQRVPRLLPPAVSGMLQAGETLGDLHAVIPACRATIQDAVAETRSAVNYLMVLAFVITPASALLPLLLFRFVVPQYRAIFWGTDMELPAHLTLLTHLQPLISTALFALMILLWIGAVTYVGGPRFSAWIQSGIPHFIDAAELRLPWRRRRMQRDFCAMLAVLLDGGVPEPEALRMAAACVPNVLFRKRVERARRALEEGVGLSEAVGVVDGSGEFRWRLTQAAASSSGFARALRGWQEALDAKAYQQEQAAAQTLSTSLVLLNGLIAGGVMIALFGSLVTIIESGLLW